MISMEQEMKWKKIMKSCMDNVKMNFADIDKSIDFGAYIQPENYFVSYIFRTNAKLKAARQSGLTERINLYHKEQLKKLNYPIQGIKDCDFASQEECDEKYSGNWYYYYK